jgi:hypothetical protein
MYNIGDFCIYSSYLLSKTVITLFLNNQKNDMSNLYYCYQVQDKYIAFIVEEKEKRVSLERKKGKSRKKLFMFNWECRAKSWFLVEFVARYLVVYVIFCRPSLVLLTSFDHCVVGPSIYGFWLPLRYLQTLLHIMLFSVLIRRILYFFVKKHQAVVSCSRPWMVLLMFIVNNSSAIW